MGRSAPGGTSHNPKIQQSLWRVEGSYKYWSRVAQGRPSGNRWEAPRNGVAVEVDRRVATGGSSKRGREEKIRSIIGRKID